MIDINAKTCAENCVHTINVTKRDNKSILWIKMHDIQDKLGVRNMSDLTIIAIKGIRDTEKYKRYGKEFIDDLTGI